MRYFLAIKQNETAICRGMDGSEEYHLVKRNKLVAERQILLIFSSFYIDSYGLVCTD